MSEWQDISTAPKDGTKVLLWGPKDANGPEVYAVCMWDTIHSEWISPEDAPEVHTCPDAFAWIGFTNWLPLPEPPK